MKDEIASRTRIGGGFSSFLVCPIDAQPGRFRTLFDALRLSLVKVRPDSGRSVGIRVE